MSSPVAPRLNLPAPGMDGVNRPYLLRLIEAISSQLRSKLSSESANDAILLRSPSGKVYSVTVDDSGVVTTTYVQG
jgi:hypothetical protein